MKVIAAVITVLLFLSSGVLPVFARPLFPVIFIHGLASGAETWEETGRVLAGNDWRFGGCPIFNRAFNRVNNLCAQNNLNLNLLEGDFYRLQFSSSQNLTFTEQAEELEAIVDAVRAANPGKKQVILVAHSMGGLAARTYLQFPEVFASIGKVRKLITIGTPHQGAEFAVMCRETPFMPRCETGSIALVDLEPNSLALQTLNDLSRRPLPRDMGYTSVVGTGLRISFGLRNLFKNQDGDGIVPAFSQNLANIPGVNFLNHTVTTLFVPFCDGSFFLQSHTCETSDQGIRTEILIQINRILLADINGDGSVNSLDWSLMNAHWLSGYPSADLNGDGLVNSLDFSILNSNWLRRSP